MSEEFMTNAAVLGSFRKELLEQGFTEGEAFEMVREASRTLVADSGLAVRNV